MVLQYLQNGKYHIDQNNLFIWGYSAGAHLGFLLANEPEVNVNAVVIGGTPTYLPGYPKSDMIIDLMGTKYEDNKQAWEEAKALEAADQVRFEKLLKQIPDATKLTAFIAKAGDVEKLERLLGTRK